jgi:hypothetical protein
LEGRQLEFEILIAASTQHRRGYALFAENAANQPAMILWLYDVMRSLHVLLLQHNSASMFLRITISAIVIVLI